MIDLKETKMKTKLIKFLCSLFPMGVIRFLAKYKYVKQHQFPVTTLIHRRKAKIIYEIEFNWYDHDLMPVSLVREVLSGKRYSVSYHELYEFKEFQGKDRSIGSSIG